VDLERQKRTRSCGRGESGEGPGNDGTAVRVGSTKSPVVPQVPAKLQQEAKQPVSEKVEKPKKPRTYPWNGLSPSTEDLAWVDPKEYEPSTLLSPSILLHASEAYTCRRELCCPSCFRQSDDGEYWRSDFLRLPPGAGTPTSRVVRLVSVSLRISIRGINIGRTKKIVEKANQRRDEELSLRSIGPATARRLGHLKSLVLDNAGDQLLIIDIFAKHTRGTLM
jgi:hypothetical protein